MGGWFRFKIRRRSTLLSATLVQLRSLCRPERCVSLPSARCPSACCFMTWEALAHARSRVFLVLECRPVAIPGVLLVKMCPFIVGGRGRGGQLRAEGVHPPVSIHDVVFRAGAWAQMRTHLAASAHAICKEF